MSGQADRRPGIVAALHEARGGWRIVAAQGRPFRILEAATLAPGGGADLAAMLKRLRAERLVRLIPGSQTIARAVNIPRAGAEQTLSALRLLAEAELPESIPPHRRAAGVIAEGPESRTGLLTGWAVRGEPPASLAERGVEERWVSEIAALSALRSSGTAAWADESTGAVSIIAPGPARTVARVLVEDNADAPAWRANVGRALAEACAAAGAEPVEPGGRLTLDGASRAALAGAAGARVGEGAWLEDFGLALGAAMLALSDDPARRSLAEATVEPTGDRAAAVERAVAWLSVRRNAWAAMAASVALILVLPLGGAWARLAVLESKAERVRAHEAERRELGRSAALYAQLEKSRWPMTKLLADLSGAMPIGVQAKSVRLSPEQGLSLEASADGAPALATLQQNLNKTGIFRGVQITRAETGAGGAVEFELSAQVVAPLTAAPPAEDFAARPLAVRLYGEGASNTAWRAGNGGGSPRGGRTDRAPRTESREGASAESGTSAPARPTAAADELPPVLTDEQIKAMDRNTAMKAWVTRQTYLQKNKSLDEATRERLTSEIEKAKAQMNAQPSP